MYTFEYTIQDPIGIHARPAGQLAKLATGFSSKVQICKGDQKVELRRLMAVMGLGIKHGETICTTRIGRLSPGRVTLTKLL